MPHVRGILFLQKYIKMMFQLKKPRDRYLSCLLLLYSQMLSYVIHVFNTMGLRWCSHQVEFPLTSSETYVFYVYHGFSMIWSQTLGIP